MKNRIKKILCPIDFSDAANNAIDYAAKLSKQLNASLTLWNMCEIPIRDEMASKANLPNALGRKEKELTEILQDWCEEIKAEYEIPCGYSIGTGISNLEQTLAHYIDGENFDLIVAGTNGADDMYQFFFGTNSYRIMKSVQCPVMVVPEGYEFKKINSVLFATNYSSGDAQLAQDLMNTFNTNISFVHVSKKEGLISNEVYHAFKNIFEEQLEGEMRSVKFRRIIDKDKLDGLVEIMIEEEAEVVILSTMHRNWLEEVFHKSFTKKVLDGIQIPALIFQHTKEENDYSISLKE